METPTVREITFENLQMETLNLREITFENVANGDT